MLNPLQIRPAPRDVEDEQDKLYCDDGNGLSGNGQSQISDLACHIKNLEIFFKLYIPSLSDIQKAILKICIIELYNNFNIDWETDITKLRNTDFPTFTDLHKLISKKAEKEKSEPEYKELSLLLYDIAYGSDRFLWNGHSTIETSSRCICLDTRKLIFRNKIPCGVFDDFV